MLLDSIFLQSRCCLYNDVIACDFYAVVFNIFSSVFAFTQLQSFNLLKWTIVGFEERTSSTKGWKFWADFLSHGTYWHHQVMLFYEVVLWMTPFSNWDRDSFSLFVSLFLRVICNQMMDVKWASPLINWKLRFSFHINIVMNGGTEEKKLSYEKKI